MGLTGNALDYDVLVAACQRKLKAMVAMGWTQAAIARSIGRERKAINGIINGRNVKDMPLRTYVKIANLPLERSPRDALAAKAVRMMHESGLTQRELAEAMGLSVNSVEKYFDLRRRMHKSTALRIIDAMERLEEGNAGLRHDDGEREAQAEHDARGGVDVR